MPAEVTGTDTGVRISNRGTVTVAEEYNDVLQSLLILNATGTVTISSTVTVARLVVETRGNIVITGNVKAGIIELSGASISQSSESTITSEGPAATGLSLCVLFVAIRFSPFLTYSTYSYDR